MAFSIKSLKEKLAPVKVVKPVVKPVIKPVVSVGAVIEKKPTVTEERKPPVIQKIVSNVPPMIFGDPDDDVPVGMTEGIVREIIKPAVEEPKASVVEAVIKNEPIPVVTKKNLPKKNVQTQTKTDMPAPLIAAGVAAAGKFIAGGGLKKIGNAIGSLFGGKKKSSTKKSGPLATALQPSATVSGPLKAAIVPGDTPGSGSQSAGTSVPVWVWIIGGVLALLFLGGGKLKLR